MVTSLVVYKEKFINIYKRYETYINIVLKFICAFIVFGYINKELGYFKALSGGFIRLVLSVVGAVVPGPIFVLLVAVVVLLHLYKLSMALSLLALVFFVVFYFFFIKFSPKQSVLMLAVPVLMPFNLHYSVPIFGGLVFNPYALCPTGLALISIKLVSYIKEAAQLSTSTASIDVEGILESYKYVMDHLLEDKELILYIFVFALVTVVTYIVSHLSFDFAWYVGIGAGAAVSIVGLLVGGGILGVSVGIFRVLFGTLLSAALVCVIQFFRCTVDYSRKEYTQFEDDDYYYYVKAIPKVTVAPREKNVKKFRPDDNREDEFEYTDGKSEPEFEDDYETFIARQAEVRSGSEGDLAKTQVRPSINRSDKNVTKVVRNTAAPEKQQEPDGFDELDMEDDF